jgi:MtrB/PioB family decaheme-associated outer membrane protein
MNNRVAFVVWDNPRILSDTTTAQAYTSGTGSAAGRASLPPDNEQHAIRVNGGITLPLESRFNASLGYVIGTQSDELLPYTINTAIRPGAANTPPVDASDPSSLPVSKADGKITTLNQSYTLDSRPVKRLGVRLRYLSHDTDNKTTGVTFPGQVRMDQVWEPGDITSKPYGSHKQRIDGDVTVDLLSQVSVEGGYGFESIDRTHREVEETTEHTLRGSLTCKPVTALTVRTGYITSEREMEEFHADDYKGESGSFIELPGLRRSDVADRDRRRVTATLQAALNDVWVGVSGYYQKTDYEPGKGDLRGGVAGYANQMYGLRGDTDKGATLSVDLPLLSSLTLLYDVQWIKRTERSNVSGATLTQNVEDDWTATSRDMAQTVGFDATVTLPEGLMVGAAYTLSLSKGKIDVTDIVSTTPVETNPPDTESNFHELTLRAEYPLKKGVALVGTYSLNVFDVEDFAVGDVPIVAGRTATGALSPNAIYLGDSLRDYTGHVAYLSVTYRW